MIDLLWLAISIVAIIFLIVKVKLHPAMSLILGTLLLGVLTQIDIDILAKETADGFGSLMAGIGLSVGFGIILGQLLSDSGGAQVIARTVVNLTSERFAMYGLAIAAFLLSVPVFYDVTFVILVPLAVPIAREANKPLPLAVGSVALGAGIAHTMIPPTPNPLAAAEILNFSIDTMMLVGLIVGFLALLVSVALYSWLLPKIWKPEKDIDPSIEVDDEIREVEKAPGFFLSLTPILVPILFILVGTGWNLFSSEDPPPVVAFLGDKTIALLIGALVAYIIAGKSLDKDERDNSATVAVQNAGIVLLVTGAGGAFGAIIKVAEIDKTIASSIQALGGNYILALLLCYIVGVAFRVAVGSGTVASITTMTIMASIAPELGIHAVWVAMACLAGALTLGHINDSGFWVTAKLPGFTMSGGLKTYTVAQSIAGIFALVFTLIGATVIPI